MRVGYLAALLLLAPAAGLAESVGLDGNLQPRIVNGLTTHGHSTTGGLLLSHGGPITADNAELWCSGTLIGCQTFLVAAHCVDDPNPGHYWVYLQHAGVFTVGAVNRHPSFTESGFPISDVAVLHLDEWVTGIAPSPINQTDPLPFISTTGTIVGFGQSAGFANDYGIKRAGTVQTATCPSGLPSGAGDVEEVCWKFLAPIGAPGTDSNTCNGDSGGPLFLDLGSGPVVAGVTSGGTSFDCRAPDLSYDANIYTYRSYVLAELGSDATTTCGGLPPVGNAQTTEIARDGGLEPLDPSDSYNFTVPAGANALRVTLNGEDNGTFDADLYVKQGPGAGSASFDCRAVGRTVFGGCTVNHPAAGTWSMTAERVAGDGIYQLTATIFGGAAPVCGNGTREFDETCDGADDSLCNGLCQSDCTCPAPLCGNDVQEQGEACDGLDAPACPGACAAGCTCPVPCASGDLFDTHAHVNSKRVSYRSRLLDFDHQFDGVDPRNGFSLTLRQGVASVTLTVPAGDSGWYASKPDKGLYKWRGDLGGFNRVKLLDRSDRTGTWKIFVTGKLIAGAGAFDPDLPIDVALTVDDECTLDTF
ncbi:MAG: trypsin-like serine protease [bacterium]